MYGKVITKLTGIKKAMCAGDTIWQEPRTVDDALRDLEIPLSDGTSFNNDYTRYVGGFYPTIKNLPTEIYGFAVTWNKVYVKKNESNGGDEYKLIARINGYPKVFEVVYLR